MRNEKKTFSINCRIFSMVVLKNPSGVRALYSKASGLRTYTCSFPQTTPPCVYRCSVRKTFYSYHVFPVQISVSMRTALFFTLFTLSLPVWFSNMGCNDNPYAQGQILYTNFCTSCHMDDGAGLRGVIPPLANADYYRQNRAALPCIIKHGINDTLVVNGKTYTQPMAGIEQLNAVEIANIINYINHQWDMGSYTTVQSVEEALKACAHH